MNNKKKRRSKPTLQIAPDTRLEGRGDMEVDIDRMVNEGLGGGRVIPHVNGEVSDPTPKHPK